MVDGTQIIQIQQQPHAVNYIPLPPGQYVPSNTSLLTATPAVLQANPTIMPAGAVAQQVAHSLIPAAASPLMNGYPMPLSPQQQSAAAVYLNGRPTR